ncbi:hypothetical protein [Chromohalobacter israelensis]|uniref:hypothetical protein n=1 Tax=Chromohalobacter israelensis TaxID=141390 RepID=UPI00265B7756|nr:hypothetical protein [Chromohalobacter salexigens]MDO0945268.1 hypothetical protein [Chromohalobacter salexigens]
MGKSCPPIDYQLSNKLKIRTDLGFEMKTMSKNVLAVAALSALATNVHADSLRDAIASGNVSGELRNTYAHGSYSAAADEAGALNNSHVLGSALVLGYETGSYHGFKIGTAFQKGHDWGIQDEDSGTTLSGGENDERATIDSAALYLGYLEYSFDRELTDTRLSYGRQRIVSPLIMNSGAFPMQDSFDALVVENGDLQNTSLEFMRIERWVMRYGSSSSGSLTQEDKDYDEPIYSLYAVNNSIEGLNVEAQWLVNDNNDPVGDPPTAVTTTGPYETGFLGLDYRFPNSKWGVGAKVLTANYDNQPDTGYWGVKANTEMAGVGVQVAYTSVKDDASFPGTLGHVPIFRSYDPALTHEIFAGLETTSLTMAHGFGLEGFEAVLGYSAWQQSEAGIENSGKDYDGGYEVSLDLIYDVQSVPGLHARVKSSYMDFDQASVSNDDFAYMRLSLNYAF